MKRIIPLAALLLSFSTIAPAIDAYIVAGQSNGWRLSQINGKELAADEKGSPKVHYFGMKCVSEPDESIMVTLKDLAPNSKSYGLVQSLIRQSGNEDIVFIQYCRCGAPVTGEAINSWWPGEDPRSGKTFDGGLFGLFPTYIQKARAQVESELGEKMEIKGLFWHQGESNITTDKTEFEQTMRNVFGRFREILGDENLPIVAGHIRDLGDGPAGVNAALDRISASDPDLQTVPLAHLQFEADKNGKPDVHIATAGCIELGAQMAGAMAALLPQAETFTIYAPSRSTNQVWEIHARPDGDTLQFEPGENITLNFSPATITSHPFKPQLYVSSNRPSDDGSGGAVVDVSEPKARTAPFKIENGYSYLSLDRRNRFLLGCSYGAGVIDVYALDTNSHPTDRVATLNEGRKNAHCVLPTLDNRFIYIPYVKDMNALYQYQFDQDTGALTPLAKLDAEPPEGTGPRHLAYHPTLPVQYFSNEQHLGVSVYDRAENGLLTIKQVCDLTGPKAPEEGVSSSDIVITADGKFLFAGIRGHKHDFDFISRYEVLKDGTVKHLGLTPADKIPWGLALSPDEKYLLATGFEAGTLMAYSIGEEGDLKRVGTFEWDKQISDLVTQ